MKIIITSFFCVFLALSCFAQNQAPVGVPDTDTIIEQVPAIIDVKVNDYDPDGDEFYIFDIGLFNTSSATVEIVEDKIRIKSNPEYTFIRLWYQLHDGNNLSAKTTVIVYVLPNPELPVAVADTVNLMQLIPQQVDILSNDYDPNGDEYKIFSAESTYTCSVTVNDDSLSVNATLNLSANEYFFWYNIIEKNTGDNFISKRVQVTGNSIPNPDMPVIVNDEVNATGGIETALNVLQNDYDPQGDLIEVAGFTPPDNGLLTLSYNKFYYTPSLSFAGSDSFSYVIREKTDTTIYSNPGIVNITVAKNPDCPVGITDYASTMTGVEIIIDVMANDYDINNNPFTFKAVEGGTITADNKIKYKSSLITLNADTIRYQIKEIGNPDSSFT